MFQLFRPFCNIAIWIRGFHVKPRGVKVLGVADGAESAAAVR